MSRLTAEHGPLVVTTLLAAMLAVRAEVEDGEHDQCEALCAKISSHLRRSPSWNDEIEALRTQLYREWPKFSGDKWYPVPGRGTEEDDEAVADYVMDRYDQELDFDDQKLLAEMYFNTVDEERLHDGDYWTGRYGVLRRELMQFMIDELQKEAIA